ncbi:MAG: hypothetical protein P1U89_04850 [Verrucomicrobiales bacterium]|nr:hypothetical protein [Verrucomicrobiales bacterium]
MTESKIDRMLLLILRLGAFGCFAGWTWVHFYWEGPYGALLWNDATFELAERFGFSWEGFVGSGANDGLVQKWISGIGWLYLSGCVFTLLVRENSRVLKGCLIAGSGLLLILAFAKYLSAQRQLPMLIEHGGQILSPVLLVMALSLGIRHRVTVATAIIACVMTFGGHGAYALGLIWPTPANFFGMTTVILHLDYGAAKLFLQVAGILDFVVCGALFIPVLRRPAALYAAIWGLITALARPVAGMSLSLNYWGSDQFLHEVVLRAPHFMIPLFLFFVWRKVEPARADEEASTSVARNPVGLLSTFFTDKSKT